MLFRTGPGAPHHIVMSRVRGVAPVRVRLSDPPAYHAPEGDLQLQCARASLSGTDGIVLKYSSPLARLPWTTRAQQGTLGVIGAQLRRHGSVTLQFFLARLRAHLFENPSVYAAR